ncbi:hypothetical protein ACVIHI_000110 [Bradyrhizobium sp. USDA 4524]|nr:hypothetical protein [Bradyrhizobium sp. USDA 4538]MCP1899090.1 hypothetical protein [Bradyrhizobium sp. USDA 4537]MCP1986797.1 hypothetical protein [Bradyrhizobium sp. USDA 4539]
MNEGKVVGGEPVVALCQPGVEERVVLPYIVLILLPIQKASVERFSAIPCVGRHLRLAVERQMPMILGVDHMRDQSLGGQSSSDQSLGSGVLEDDAVTERQASLGRRMTMARYCAGTTSNLWLSS